MNKPCPGENVLRVGLVYICQDSRKADCPNLNIVGDGGDVEIYVCQNPKPKGRK
jgi:hypothetical protein